MTSEIKSTILDQGFSATLPEKFKFSLLQTHVVQIYWTWYKILVMCLEQGCINTIFF